MTIHEIEAKSILRKHKKIDSWFLSCYGMNFYRGCAHNCVYCDGRAEKYSVDGEFGEDVAVKVNAMSLLRRELDPSRKRIPLKKCYMMVGGGVGDSYQPIEARYKLTRQALELLFEFHLPAHILTKSTLIERDLDILQKINRQSRAIVNFSFSSLDEKISGIFEPGVPSPQRRLETIERIKQAGIPCGLFLMPVIPFITDTPEHMSQVLERAKQVGVDYVLFSGMTLKDGRQKQFFLETIRRHFPQVEAEYAHIYPGGDPWGQARPEYYNSIHQTFFNLARNSNIPVRMPAALFKDMLSENDLVVVLLEHIDYYCKIQNRTSPFGFAAYSLSQLKQPIASLRGNLQHVKGVGKTTESIIIEILETGDSSYLKKVSGY
ncbi:MAG: radical SAM protein [Candidatus Zhuqueibacterota bacterium]